MDIPKDCRYTKDHEWIRVEGDGARIGITDFAQSALGDIVFVDLPKPGAKLKQMEELGSVEAVKTVSPINSPVSGEVLAVNEAIADDPSIVNRSPYQEGWMLRIRMSDPSEMDRLLTPEAYEEWARQEAEH
jgi:glycine cleavage system H protein